MKFREAIRAALLDAIRSSGYDGGDMAIVLEQPRQKAHGDVATPVAMSLAKELRKDPMEIAEAIARSASFPKDIVEAVEVARPGFINMTLSSGVLRANLREIMSRGESYGRGEIGRGERCLVEYVSANPTGPLVIVSARAAAVGSVIVSLLGAAGYDVESEYYVNDFGKQVEALGESLRFRVRERLGRLEKGEEISAYRGEYLKDIASKVPEQDISDWEEAGEGRNARYGEFATEALLGAIREDLEHFGVRFDGFFRESTLYPELADEARRIIEEKRYTYEREGALYFRTSSLGDEKDRVLVKSDGNATYFLGDIAYHLTKLRRGYNWVIDLLGPDHHGHIPRMKAAASVIGAGPEWLEVILVGWVRLLEGGKTSSMSKRAGEFISMRELIDDVGSDVAKYFFLMRRSNTPLDFDLALARKQSEENPVYYVQYAHARISSVIRFAAGKGIGETERDIDLGVLTSPEERALMLHLLFYPQVVESAALSREPHRLTVYAQELATLFHQFYHVHRIVTDDAAAAGARLLLAESTMQVLRNALDLMGVSAPSSM